ncbi:hypothetical protein MCHI_000126 [Candidatus Magnetoovum chiemensis]|nr:hypothetical protein MCHI_000126 [Candidatus Magnetoovum chiemensis]
MPSMRYPNSFAKFNNPNLFLIIFSFVCRFISPPILSTASYFLEKKL